MSLHRRTGDRTEKRSRIELFFFFFSLFFFVSLSPDGLPWELSVLGGK